MKFEAFDSSQTEGESRREVSLALSEEEKKLYELIIGAGGVIDSRAWRWQSYAIARSEKVTQLLKKGMIGKCERTLENSTLFYDNLDERLKKLSEHPRGIEVYYELKHEAGYPDEHIPILYAEILKRYDELKRANRRMPDRRILAAAFVLTCRGKYQCPTKMLRYFKLAGGISTVCEMGEKIGEGIRYDPEERIKAYIPKLNLDEVSLQKFRELWEKEREEGVPVTPVYIGALAYVAARLSNKKIPQREIAHTLGISIEGLRRSAKKICERQGLSLPTVRR
jgi:hypothetical protein